MLKYITLLVFAGITISSIKAQEVIDNQHFPSHWLETLAEEGMDVEQSSELDDLQDLIQNPLNLNVATQQALHPFFFLSDIQIQNLLFYLDENGPMLSIYELQAVEGFTENTIQLLLPFVTVIPVEKEQPVTGYHLARWQMPLTKSNEPTNYLGNRQKWYWRTLVKDPNFTVGFAAEKDAGEPAFNSSIKLTDHYAAFLQHSLKNNKGHWVIGDYRVSFGQGLALSLGSNMSRSANPSAIRLRPQTLKGYASSDELRYLRGAAAELNLSHSLTVVPFISYKRVDASLTSDSSMIESLSATGYHRTQSELNKRHQEGELLTGASIIQSFKRIRVEGGSYYYRLTKPVAKSFEPYQLYQFSGQTCANGWIAYTAAFRQLMLFGEISFLDFKTGAISQGLLWEPDGKLSLSIRYQSFALGYFSPYMAPGSRSGDPSGETNFYLGLIIRPKRNVELVGYLLSYKYKWLHYQIDAPSSGNDIMVRLNLNGVRKFIHNYQFKYRKYEKNAKLENQPTEAITAVDQYNMRWQGVYQPVESWRFTTRIEYCHYRQQSVTSSNGTMMFQDVCYNTLSGQWHFQFRYLMFNTDDYNSRIYTYEPDVRYGFAIPALSGKGTRLVMTAHYSPSKQWDFYLKCGLTSLVQQSDQLERSADVKLQLIYNIWHKKATLQRVAE